LPAFSNVWSPTTRKPGSLSGVDGVMCPLSSAATAVTSLKVDPVG
jgi:hypothetical protein